MSDVEMYTSKVDDGSDTVEFEFAGRSLTLLKASASESLMYFVAKSPTFRAAGVVSHCAGLRSLMWWLDTGLSLDSTGLVIG